MPSKADAAEQSVYERMIAIIDELPAIGKTQQNTQQNFMFRGHDDVMNALNPLLAKHGVLIVPDVLERIVGTRQTSRGSTMYEVNLHVRFTFYGAGGDSFTASGWGEGTDMGDKATSKAMTMAIKYVIAQAFALATAEISDADASSAEETTRVRDSREQGSPRQTGGPATGNSRSTQGGTQASTWAGVKKVIYPFGKTIWDDWLVFGEHAKQYLYPDEPELSDEQKAEMLRVTCVAANKLASEYSPSEFPPPGREAMTAAWKEAIDAELEGPIWRMSADEEDRPTREEYAELQKVEA